MTRLDIAHMIATVQPDGSIRLRRWFRVFHAVPYVAAAAGTGYLIGMFWGVSPDMMAWITGGLTAALIGAAMWRTW